MSGCNPTNTTGCPPDPALGTTQDLNFLVKFIGDSPYFYQYPEVDWDAQGLEMNITSDTDRPFIYFPNYIFFGSAAVTLQPLPGMGIVTFIALASDDQDVIFWAVYGARADTAQINFARKGVAARPDFYVPVANATTSIHKYGVNWNQTEIAFLLDDQVVQTASWSDAGNGTAYPQTPLQLRVFSTVAAFANSSTAQISLAGGYANMSDGPFRGHIQRVQLYDNMNDHSSALEYVYTDQSGNLSAISVVPNPTRTPSPSSGTVTSTPTQTSSTQSSSPKPTLPSTAPSQVNTGAIAGGVIGGIALILLVALGFLFYRRRRKAAEESQ